MKPMTILTIVFFLGSSALAEGKASTPEKNKLAAPKKLKKKKRRRRAKRVHKKLGKKKSQTSVVLVPMGRYSKIDAVDVNDDSSASFVSNLSAMVQGQFSTRIFDNFSAYIDGFFALARFEPPQDKSFVDSDATSFGGGLGAIYHLDNKKFVGLGGYYTQEVFLRGRNINTFSLDKAFIISVRPFAQFQVATFETSHLSLKINGVFNLPGDVDDYQSQFGYGAGGDLIWTKKLSRSLALDARVGYQYVQKDTTLFLQNHQDMNFGVGLKWML